MLPQVNFNSPLTKQTNKQTEIYTHIHIKIAWINHCFDAFVLLILIPSETCILPYSDIYTLIKQSNETIFIIYQSK